MKKAIILAVIGLFSLGHAVGYYVAPWGNDTNPGTSTRPWRTINKAATTLVAGDSVLIRAGIYRESVNPARSGTAALPITYKNYGTEEVVVEGGEVVTGWTQDSGNRYRATVNFTPSPRFNSLRDPRNNKGGLVLQNGAKMRYAMAPSLTDVDLPGEYYMNDSASPPYTMYVYVRDLGSGYDPNNYQLTVGRYRKGFDLDGGEDYQIADGLTFRDYNDNAIHSIGSNYCQFKNLKLYSNFITGIYLTDYSRNCLIERCAFWDNGHGGIELARSHSATVRRNKFTSINLGDGLGGNGAHIWNGPLTYLSDSCLFENNLGFRSGSDYISSGFIVIRGNYCLLRHNSGVNSGMGGITLLDGGDNTVVNNAIDASQGMACIAVFPEAVADSGHLIRYNDWFAQDPTQKYWWNGIRYNSIAEWQAASGQTNNFAVRPGFVQPDSEDLHLMLTSPCIDSGTSVNASSEDYDGNARPQGRGYDIGAYEYLVQQVAEGPAAARGLGLISIRPNPATHGIWFCRANLLGSGQIRIFDLAGRTVRVIDIKENQSEAYWDGRDDRRTRLPAGTYYLVYTAGSRPEAERKCILLR